MSRGSAALPLAGRGIVITRPAAQATTLAQLIEARGGRAILFPVLEILEVADAGPLTALIDRLETFDFAIFVSPNAVEKAMSAIRARRELPHRLQFAAIGLGSRRALRRHGVTSVIAPAARYDSEALLDLPELRAVSGKRIAIFRGAGGRELLRDQLIARGAQVEYAECYRRARPETDAGPLMEALRRGEVDAFVVTSAESLQNLYDMLGESGRRDLERTPVFVPHPRIAASAHALGLAAPIVTEPGDEGIAATLAQHFSGAR